MKIESQENRYQTIKSKTELPPSTQLRKEFSYVVNGGSADKNVCATKRCCKQVPVSEVP